MKQTHSVLPHIARAQLEAHQGWMLLGHPETAAILPEKA